MQAAVILAHTAIGPHDVFVQQKIKDLAQAGYVAFALDMYGVSEIVLGVLFSSIVFNWSHSDGPFLSGTCCFFAMLCMPVHVLVLVYMHCQQHHLLFLFLKFQLCGFDPVRFGATAS
jgi:hypothetical protein